MRGGVSYIAGLVRLATGARRTRARHSPRPTGTRHTARTTRHTSWATRSSPRPAGTRHARGHSLALEVVLAAIGIGASATLFSEKEPVASGDDEDKHDDDACNNSRTYLVSQFNVTSLQGFSKF